MMEQEQAFVDAIRAQPEDDAPRLAYADWLRERGDPRGELIDAQVRWDRANQNLDLAAMQPHGVRSWQVQRQHEQAWMAPLFALGLNHYSFRRGFVETGGIYLADFLKNSAKLFELAPLLTDLGIYDKKDTELLPRLAEHPPLSHLKAVTFWGSPISATALSTFAASPFAVNLRYVRLREVRLYGPDLPAGCVQLLKLPRLTQFAFTENGVCPRGPRQRIPPTPIGDEVVVALAQAPELAQLRVLHVSSSKGVTDAAVAALASSPYLACSDGLDIYGTALTDAAAQALAAAPRAACLTRLTIVGNELGNQGLEAVIESPHLGALRELTIGARITDPGAAMLAASPASARLRRLDFSYNRQLGVRGAEALAASEHLSGLQVLSLCDTRIGPRGALALIHSSQLPGLRGLHVGTEGGGWPPEVREALKQRFGG
jgi:uncharacterized protein (TIGR02996 family)